MTAKRFTSKRTDDYNFSDVLDNGKWVGICHVDCEDDFVNKFNELAEENEQLQSRINDYDVALKRLQDLCERKLKENEQLKQDKDLFAQCICDLSNRLYDNKIEHKLPKDIKDFITVWGVRIE